jgi:hypothetical protein
MLVEDMSLNKSKNYTVVVTEMQTSGLLTGGLEASVFLYHCHILFVAV